MTFSIKISPLHFYRRYIFPVDLVFKKIYVLKSSSLQKFKINEIILAFFYFGRISLPVPAEVTLVLVAVTSL